MSVTANGWPVLTQLTGIKFVATGEGGAHDVVNQDVARLAAWQVYRHHTEIEPVTAVGGARTVAEQALTNPLAVGSNHCSGTAWDVNGGRHPYEASQHGPWSSGFSAAGIAVIRDILRECEVLQWGGDFSSPWRDAMHWQIKQANPAGNGPRIISDAEAHAAAAKIEAKVKRIQKSVGATVDGFAGPGMLAAVKAWQKKNGLTVDGIFGPASQHKAGWDKPKPQPKFPLPAGHAYAVNDHTARTHSGARPADRDEVRKIQRKVGVAADGDFGNHTKAAVAAYQRHHGLHADGEVGPATWRKMF